MEKPVEKSSLLTKSSKFSCKLCDFKSCNKKDYNRHLNTVKHMELFGTIDLEKKPLTAHALKPEKKEFELPSQSGVFYKSSRKKPLNISGNNSENVVVKCHFQSDEFSNIPTKSPSKKPLIISSNNSVNGGEKCERQCVITLSQDTHTCVCNKQYKTASGLWKHKKTCETLMCNSNESKETNPIAPKFDEHMLSAFMTIIQQNQEFKDFMIDQAHEQQKYNQDIQNQNHEFQTQLLELAKEGRNTVINNTSFNLHVYLNETCKNAMNMLDYVNSLQLDLTDLEETGKLGYTNGMSRIFINGLKDMDVHMRPIHCSDLKREVLYIKEDNVWEKDNENRDKLKSALRKIEKKNIMLIPVWIKAHPNCIISSHRENTPYLKMVMQSTGGENPSDTADMAKIITNIAKAVVINK